MLGCRAGKQGNHNVKVIMGSKGKNGRLRESLVAYVERLPLGSGIFRISQRGPPTHPSLLPFPPLPTSAVRSIVVISE